MMAHTPYGYTIKNGRAEADKIQEMQVRTLFEEYVAGSSLQSAGAKAVIGKSHSSLGLMIDSPYYKGDDFYPAIVSHELWSKAQKERKRRSDALGRNKNYFADDKTDISPFWGKVFCSECGCEYCRYSRKDKQVWRCSQRSGGGKAYCNSPLICESVFEKAFVRTLGNLDFDEIASKPPRKLMHIEQKYDNPFEQAEYAYSLTQIDDFEYQTNKLLGLLEEIPIEFNGEYMKKIIKRIEVSHDGRIVFVFINGKRYGEESDTNGRENHINDTAEAEETNR